jgi:hypothetical protein
MGGTSGTYGEEERSIQGTAGENEGKRIIGRPRCRWEHKMKLDTQKIGSGYGLD